MAVKNSGENVATLLDNDLILTLRSISQDLAYACFRNDTKTYLENYEAANRLLNLDEEVPIGVMNGANNVIFDKIQLLFLITSSFVLIILYNNHNNQIH